MAGKGGHGGGGGGGGSSGNKKRKLKREELAVLVSVVAAAVVIVQKFLADNDLLLLPSQTMALEASVRATALALAKLQTMFSVADVISIAAAAEDAAAAAASASASASRAPWFSRFMAAMRDDGAWRDNFRMSRATFALLVERLRPVLAAVAGAPDAEVRVGAAVFRLAHGAPFRDVARRFGVATRVACEAFYEVCKLLDSDFDNHRLEDLASPDSAHAIADAFEALNMPNCCGIVGHTRFLVDDSSAYDASALAEFRDPRDGRHSVIMQALVDSSGRFLDASVGWAGSLTPPAILPATLLYTYVETTGELLQGHPATLLNNFPMPQYVIGSRSCPLYPWLLTPYPAGAGAAGLTPVQELFNSVHGYARSAVYRSFGILKNQWRLLAAPHKRDSLDILSHVVSAACFLHNFLIRNGEPMPDVKEMVDNDFPDAVERNDFAESIRDGLASHISMVVQL